MDELVIEYSDVPDSNILNGHVYRAYLDVGKNCTKTAEKLNVKRQDVSNLERKIVKTTCKNLSRNREAVIAVLKQPFGVKRRIPKSTSLELCSPRNPPSPAASDPGSAVFIPQTPISPSPVLVVPPQTPTPPFPVLDRPPQTPSSVVILPPQTPTPPPPVPVVLPLPHPSTSTIESTDICQRCVLRTTMHSVQIESLTTELKKRKAEIVDLKSEIEVMRKTYKVSVVNQKYKRLEDRIDKLKLEKRNVNVNKNETERKIKRQKRNSKYYYKKRKREAEEKTEDVIGQSEQRAEQDAVEIQSLRNALDELVQSKDSVDKTNPILLYNASVRICTYSCLMRHVSTAEIGNVINDILREFNGKPLSNIPTRQSVENMARELEVLNDIQAGETILSANNIALHWDSTTKAGRHINAIHMTAAKGSFLLSLSEISSSSSDAYCLDIQNSLKDIAHSYCSYYTDNEDEAILTELYGKFTCAITDRAAANHATVQKLQNLQLMVGNLIELNCHLHPLDSFATKTKQYLRSQDVKEVNTQCFGSEAHVVNLIAAISKLRYKGKGEETAC